MFVAKDIRDASEVSKRRIGGGGTRGRSDKQGGRRDTPKQKWGLDLLVGASLVKQPGAGRAGGRQAGRQTTD